jgi:serine/threonine-protein kinase
MQGSLQSSTLVPFGKYLLDEEIARGGMARVYLARLRGLGGFEKRLVVKQVLPELARDPRFVEMFVEEAKTLVQMSHPNIVPVYELGVVDGVYFLAMEHVEGATLAELLRDGPLAPPMVAHVAAEVCDALAYAHERFGLVHRDVTPRNVMVDALGHARLLDFGIAAPVHGGDDQEGEVFGSHGYMSPEQARGEQVSPKSDIFSLGAVLYEALTGKPAFLRESPEATRAALLEAGSPTLEGYETIPVDLRALVQEMLTEDLETRPAAAARLGQRFRGFLASTRPEGVAPELGEKAAHVLERRRRVPSQRPPSSEGRAPGAERTIATSVTLRQILGEDEGRQNGKTPAPDVESQGGTMPIPGRKSMPDGIAPPASSEEADDDELFEADAQAGTAPVERARPRPEPVAEARRDELREHAAEAERTRTRLVPLVATVAVAVLLAIGVRFAFFGDDDGARTTTPEMAAGTTPRETPPDENVTTPEESSPPDTASENVASETTPPDTAQTGVQEEGTLENTTPEAPAPGRISVSARPWAVYRIDRRGYGDQPLRNREVPSGRHVVHLENESLGTSLDIPIYVPPGVHIEVIVDLTANPPSQIVRAAN